VSDLQHALHGLHGVDLDLIQQPDIRNIVRVLWLAGTLVNAVRLGVLQERGESLRKLQVPYVVSFRTSWIASEIATALNISPSEVADVIRSATFVRGSSHYDERITPFIELADDELGIIILPYHVQIFQATRRILASQDKSSRTIGSSYERW